jgi:hypothetical protein
MVREAIRKTPTMRPLFALPSWAGWPCTMKMIRCTEMFAEFPLEPTIARCVVPPGYNIRILPNEMALLLLMVQDCEYCILDGVVRVSPMRMSHIWIELEGPEEVGVVLPGTTASLPTCYYYALPHQIDNLLARTLLSFVGIDVQKVNTVSLGGAPGGVRRGNVFEDKGKLAKYSWEDSCTIWPTPRIVTGRRRFYREYGRTLKRRSEGLVECRSSFLGEGIVSLEAAPSSALGRIGIHGTLHGTVNPVEMEYCNVRIRVAGG